MGRLPRKWTGSPPPSGQEGPGCVTRPPLSGDGELQAGAP
jgi:hypothetical protein